MKRSRYLIGCILFLNNLASQGQLETIKFNHYDYASSEGFNLGINLLSGVRLEPVVQLSLSYRLEDNLHIRQDFIQGYYRKGDYRSEKYMTRWIGGVSLPNSPLFVNSIFQIAHIRGQDTYNFLQNGVFIQNVDGKFKYTHIGYGGSVGFANVIARWCSIELEVGFVTGPIFRERIFKNNMRAGFLIGEFRNWGQYGPAMHSNSRTYTTIILNFGFHINLSRLLTLQA